MIGPKGKGKGGLLKKRWPFLGINALDFWGVKVGHWSVLSA